MANNKNLKPPINQRTTNEAREISKRGGIASGVTRRKKKILKDELLTLLDVKISDENGKKATIRKKIAFALIEKALNGDVKAFEVIRDTIGEKPTDKQELNNNLGIQKIFVTPEMHRETLEHIKSVINDS